MEWKLVPVKLTAENGMKAALIGEFHVPFPELDEDGNEHIRKVNVPWTVIKQIHEAMIAAAPAPEVEPIAYALLTSKGKIAYWAHSKETVEEQHKKWPHCSITPICTHPAPPSELLKAAKKLIEHGETGGGIFDGEKHFDHLSEVVKKLSCPAPAKNP